VRISVPRGVVFVAALVAVVIPVSRYAYTWFRDISAAKHINYSGLEHPERSSDPQVLLSEADRLYWLNNGPRAAPLYAKAENLFASRGDARNELYAKIGRLRSEAETMSFVELSRFLNDQLQNPIMRNDPRLRVWCLAAKGYTDIEIDYRAEKQDWLEAQQIAKNLGDDLLATRASGELGIIAFLEGNSGRAAKLLGGALVSTMANGDKGGQIRFLEMLGNGLVEVNRPSDALMFFERAIKIAEADTDSGLPFMGYEGKAQALVALGRPDEAKRVLQEALAKARSQQKRGHEAQLLIVLGKLAAQTRNKQEAIAALEDAGQFAARVQFYRMEADAMFELAKLYRDSGDLATADARATQGLVASQRVGDRYYVPRNLTILADLKVRRGRIPEAKALYKHAEDVIDSMLGGDDSYWNSSIAAAMSQTYLQHFELVAKEADTAGAFQILERVRGRTLASALGDRKADPQSGSTEAATLDSYVATTQIRLMQTNSPVEREKLLDALAEYEWRLRLAWNQGDQRFPIDPAPLTQVQESLKADEALLEYVLDEPNSFCISITRTTANLRVLPVGRKEIENLIQRYVDEIRAKKAGAEEAKQLYSFLVQPIPETSTGKRFIVVPDGILNLLPFEALRNSEGQYLLTSDVISYAPSATVLDTLRRRYKQQEAPRPFLGVGDVAYDNQGGAGKRILASETLRGRFVRGFADFVGMPLHDLPQTREEVESISRIVGKDAETLFGANATESAFKKEPLKEFRILHLAVHGFADPQYPERSALVLGADPKASEDGLLQVREIKKLRLNAELTTLSACDTGVGKLQGEEGVSDLAEAFLAAGAKTVVASLWSADDTFASALMERFYQRLALGEETSSALRGAKLDLLTKYGEQVSPFYWAAFVAIGDASTPIRIRQQ
jgi:CHAT domain-containing protein